MNENLPHSNPCGFCGNQAPADLCGALLWAWVKKGSITPSRPSGEEGSYWVACHRCYEQFLKAGLVDRM